MSQAMAANILALLLFFGFAYVIHMRVKTKKWPRLRNPFYYKDE